MTRLNLPLTLAVAIILLTPFSCSSIVKAEVSMVATTHVESGNTTCDYPDIYGKQKTCLPVTHEGILVGESGPTICHGDTCEAVIGQSATTTTPLPSNSPAQHGYLVNYRQVLVPTTPSGEGLTPDSNKSAIYNTAFAQGYLGFPLKGHHTSEFLAAYENGTSLYFFNRGDTEGYNGINPTSSEKNNSDYIKGWKQGRDTFKDIGPSKGFESIPIHTDDNYLDYYVGQYNSAVTADKDNSSNGPGDGTHTHCGSGHTQEYCLGYTTGYQAESYLLNVA